jgi:hypothetical protein
MSKKLSTSQLNWSKMVSLMKPILQFILMCQLILLQASNMENWLPEKFKTKIVFSNLRRQIRNN